MRHHLQEVGRFPSQVSLPGLSFGLLKGKGKRIFLPNVVLWCPLLVL